MVTVHSTVLTWQPASGSREAIRKPFAPKVGAAQR
jgi:hypothetical protein